MRLIDADRLKRVLIAFFTGAHLELPHISKVIDFLDTAPTIYAVTVVRCGECKHRGTDDCPMHIKGVPADEGFLKVVDNDFCSYGEERCGDGTN